MVCILSLYDRQQIAARTAICYSIEPVQAISVSNVYELVFHIHCYVSHRDRLVGYHMRCNKLLLFQLS